MENENIKEIIEQSGHELENEAVLILEKNNWSCISSSYYVDNITGKSREVDIIAKKEFSIFDIENIENISKKKKILIKLFISCKFIKDDIVFWFGKKNIIKANELVKNGLSLNQEELERNESVLKFHHYNIEKNVANKNAQKGNKDIIFNAREESIKSFLYSPLEDDEFEYKEIYKFPIVIVNNFDNFCKRDDSSKDRCLKIENNFQFEILYSILISGHPKRKYFLVDFISIDRLEFFLKENFEKVEKKENWEIKENDISLIKKILSEKIRKERFYENRNDFIEKEEFDPYDQ
ncbi:MAG: hypothetical protein ABH956_00125 [Candidatus Nealsonbacteria bacterium]